jgi:hypothetical protein
MFRASVLIVFMSLSVWAVDLRLGVDSGVMGPVSAGDNELYDPGVFIEPRISMGLSGNYRVFVSYSHLFANGGELTENTGIFWDVYSNYRTTSSSIKIGISRDFRFATVRGGGGQRSFETERDLFGEWTAD